MYGVCGMRADACMMWFFPFKFGGQSTAVRNLHKFVYLRLILSHFCACETRICPSAENPFRFATVGMCSRSNYHMLPLAINPNYSLITNFRNRAAPKQVPRQIIIIIIIIRIIPDITVHISPSPSCRCP